MVVWSGGGEKVVDLLQPARFLGINTLAHALSARIRPPYSTIGRREGGMLRFPEAPSSRRALPAEVTLLATRNRRESALTLFNAALSSHGIATVLNLCVEVGAGSSTLDGEVLGGQLVAALQASLREDDMQRSALLLSALLTFATRRLKLPSSLPFATQLQQVLHQAALGGLFPADRPSLFGPEEGSAPEAALASTLEALVDVASAAKRPTALSSSAVGMVAGVLIRRRVSTHLLRVLSTSTLVHEPVADTLAEELRAGGERAASALSVLSSAMAHFDAEAVQKTTPFVLLNFILMQATRAPLAIAAGIDAGLVWVGWAAVLTSATPKAPAQRLAVELAVTLVGALPAEALAPRTTRCLAGLLSLHACDESADLPSRSHACSQLIELLDSREPWLRDGSELQTATVAQQASHAEITSSMLSALPQAIAASRPLSSKLLHALGALLTAAGSADEATQELLNDHFGVLLDAMGAVEVDGTHPLLCALKALPLGSGPLHHLVRWLSDSRQAQKYDHRHGDAQTARAFGNQDAAFSSLVRSQLVPPEDESMSSSASMASAATRLVQLCNANQCDADEIDVCLSCVCLSAVDARQAVVAALVKRVTPPTSEGENGDAAVSLSILARAARFAPEAFAKCMPLTQLQQALEAAVAGVPSSFDAGAGRAAPLMQLVAIALRHLGGSGGLLRFLTAHGARMALADVRTVKPLMEALFSFPGPLAQAALPHILESLHAVVAATATDGGIVALLSVIAAASPHVVRAIHSQLLTEQEAQRRERGTGSSATDEGDYMMEEAEEAADEDVISRRLLEVLGADVVHGCMPFAQAAALDCAAACSTRVAAVKALGRMMHSHEQMAERALPSLIELASARAPVAVRQQATLVFASMLISFPALTEGYSPRVLGANMAESEPLLLRRVTLGVLSDLLSHRKLKPAGELPQILPLLVSEEVLSAPALNCVQRLATMEGPLRWPRLLLSSLLQLCVQTPALGLDALLSTLIPSTLDGARAQDLEALGDSLVGHLVDAAALHAAQGATSGVHNLAQLLGAWPPSDKALGSLHKALGGGAASAPAKPSTRTCVALWAAASREPAVRRALQSVVVRSRSKHAGPTLEAISMLLAECANGGDESDEEVEVNERAPVRERNRRRTLAEAVSDGAGATAARSAMDAARNAIGALRADRPLYAAVRLPALRHHDVPTQGRKPGGGSKSLDQASTSAKRKRGRH